MSTTDTTKSAAHAGDIVGKVAADAEKALSRRNLTLGQASPQPLDPAKKIASQIPAAGELAKEGAPVVVAKGYDEIALFIRKIAKDHNIPVVENKPLARALDKKARKGKAIPVEMYAAVAEVLAFVYRLKNRGVPRPRARAARPGAARPVARN